MKEVTSLFFYLPDTFPANLKDELDRRVVQAGVNLKSSELREPGWTDEAIDTLRVFHQEGISIDQFIAWASDQMTEFELLNHTRIPVKAGLAVLVNNHKTRHRMPSGDLHRFFYKGIVGR